MTPPNILSLMQELGELFANAGWTLRSGGASGADTAFEEGADRVRGSKEIYEPWPGFSKRAGAMPTRVSPQALALAASVHPRWSSLSSGPQKLHARNCYQILGGSLSSPVDFVICWTADGLESEAARTRTSGGTATAVVLAERSGVLVYNLKNQQSCNNLATFLESVGLTAPLPLAAKVQAALF
jgi:hypothetical protein